jgi:hypothetical protein
LHRFPCKDYAMKRRLSNRYIPNSDLGLHGFGADRAAQAPVSRPISME